MSTGLRVSTNEFLTNLATVLGISRTPADWSSTDEVDVRNIIRAGLRRFYHPPPIDGGYVHQWRFLEKRLSVAAQASYSTGTVTVASGTVTGSGTTFPTWAADAIIKVDGITTFVTARGGDTSLTIDNTALAAAAGSTYELHRWRTALPTDFGEFLGPVLYNHASYARALRMATEAEIRLRYATFETEGQPTMFGIVPPEIPTGASVGTARGFMCFWPTMDTESLISGAYRAVPEDNLDNTDVRTGATTVLQSDSVHAGAMMEAILAAAEEFYGIGDGRHERAFMERLAASIKHDKAFIGPLDFTGVRGNPVDAWRLANLTHVPTLEEV